VGAKPSARSSISASAGPDPARDDHVLCILKKAAANANHAGKRLDDKPWADRKVCDEILAGQYHDMFRCMSG